MMMETKRKDLEKRIEQWIAEKKNILIEEVCELIRIKSIADKENEVKPFGQGCRDVVDRFIEICHRHGLATQNHSYYVAEAFDPDTERKPERIGLMGHLDIVPEGEGWIYPPYEGVAKGGWIIGRGAQDNKGPCLAGLYTLLCLKDLGIKLKHDIRVLAGTNEENGMEDATYYVDNCQYPDFTIVVDSPFPLCYGEKGIIEAWMVSNDPFSDQVIDITGGAVSNQVPGKAEIVLHCSEQIEERLQEKSEKCRWEIYGDKIHIYAEGISGHVAFPEETKNAIAILSGFVLERNLLISDRDRKIMTYIWKAASATDGSGLNLNCNDKISGNLVCGCGIIKMKQGYVWLNMNARYPVSINGSELMGRLEEHVQNNHFHLDKRRVLESNYYPKEKEVIRRLSTCFQRITHLDWEPQIFNAGTHARKLPNAVAYGPGCLNSLVPECEPMPEGHGGAHQPDEAQSIDCLCLALKIYILAVLEIDELDLKENGQN